MERRMEDEKLERLQQIEDLNEELQLKQKNIDSLRNDLFSTKEANISLEHQKATLKTDVEK